MTLYVVDKANAAAGPNIESPKQEAYVINNFTVGNPIHTTYSFLPQCGQIIMLEN